ncbi:MAG: tetratricopeptide repeat protein, partial [Spirochaetota bacterium]|nr:tetratricopeptide repeat protein [Spirochaetota bacterium]
VLASSETLSKEDITPDNIILGMFRVIRDNENDENINYYRDFIYTVKPDVDAQLTSAALEAENNGDYTEAIDIYIGLLRLNPDSSDHLLNIAVCYNEYSLHLFDKGEEDLAFKMEEEAFKYFKMLDEIPEKNDRIYYYLGRFYLSKENYEKAIEYFKDFIGITEDVERKKEVLDALKMIQSLGVLNEDYRYAQELVEADKDEAALESVNKFIEKYPSNWNGYHLKGFILRKLEQYDDAIENFQKALNFNGNEVDLYNELGLCYMNLGNYNKAELYFAKALRYNVDDISIYYNLAILSYQKKDVNTALKYCEIINEFSPNDLKSRDLVNIIKNNGDLNAL